MTGLKEYRLYWDGLAARAGDISETLPLTVDDDMARRIMRLERDSVSLFFLPPSSRSEARDADSWSESDDCVVFVMGRFDPQRRTSWDVLEQTQPVMERLKELMLADVAAGCCVMRLDVRSLSTMPETKFYAGFAGWSLGFRIMGT